MASYASRFSLRTALFALLVVVCVSSPAVHAILTEVAAGEQFTVSEVVTPNMVTTVQFHISADEHPINVRIEDAKGATVYTWQNEREGVYSIKASDKPSGVVLVLDNSGSRFTSVRVNFYIRKTSAIASTPGKRGPMDPIENKVQTISASLDSLQALQVTLRNQQKDHRATVEDANERVLLWSVFQVVALVGMSAFQMFFLKRFLEKRTVM